MAAAMVHRRWPMALRDLLPGHRDSMAVVQAVPEVRFVRIARLAKKGHRVGSARDSYCVDIRDGSHVPGHRSREWFRARVLVAGGDVAGAREPLPMPEARA